MIVIAVDAQISPPTRYSPAFVFLGTVSSVAITAAADAADLPGPGILSERVVIEKARQCGGLFGDRVAFEMFRGIDR